MIARHAFQALYSGLTRALPFAALSLAACSTGAIVEVDGGGNDAGGSDGSVAHDAGNDGGTLRWFTTCGDPVCRSPGDGGTTSGVRSCATEREGDTCAALNDQCDRGGSCGVLLRCAASDPKLGIGGCPISSRAFKDGIRYLEQADLERVAADVQGLRLATYTYKTDPARRPRIGFIIEDDPASAAVADNKTAVDLYGYTSMVVAAMKVQSQRIERQEAELVELRRKVDALEHAGSSRRK